MSKKFNFQIRKYFLTVKNSPIIDYFSQFLMFFNNGLWFASMMGGWSAWQWVFLNSSQSFWSFDTPDIPGCASAVFADNQSENEIWNRLKQFLLVCSCDSDPITWPLKGQ